MNGVVRAVWNGVTLAESDQAVVVEGNYYFPPEAVNRLYLRPSKRRTVCFWKGVARYHDVVVDDAVFKDGAWYYPRPTFLARRIRDHVAFWPGIAIEK